MIVEVLSVAVVVLVVMVMLLTFACYRLSKRLLDFDEFFDLLSFDVMTNIKFFRKLTATPMFESTPEIREAHNNMVIISKRLDEFAVRMQELTNKDFMRAKKEENPNPPVVI